MITNWKKLGMKGEGKEEKKETKQKDIVSYSVIVFMNFQRGQQMLVLRVSSWVNNGNNPYSAQVFFFNLSKACHKIKCKSHIA